MRKFADRHTPSPTANATTQLSDQWVDNSKICDVLRVSMSTIKRRRKDGTLIASKRFGKICFNKAHIDAFLRNGLPGMVAAITFFSEIVAAA